MAAKIAGTRELHPRGRELRHALQWFSERRKEEPEASVAKLLDEASIRFDLTPIEEDYLLQALREGRC